MYPAPAPLAFGVSMVGPVITPSATRPEEALSPRIANVDDWWCQGFSEPGSGSDLASLKTKAERKATNTSSTARRPGLHSPSTPTMIFCLCRTDPAAKKQSALFILIDMKSKGVTVRPIQIIDGSHEVNEIFFDGRGGAGREPDR